MVYYQRAKRFNARIVTALTNRLGDAGILCLIGLLSSEGRWSFGFAGILSRGVSGLVALAIFLIAMTKRAQIPFSAWLPAAIAAPTPVSSLVHSSTLVTAGVYLLIRFNYSFTERGCLWYLAFIGGITSILAGGSAMLEVDIKKIIALSTLRQLGLIVSTLGAGLPLFAFVHLNTHAYFKAMLFMCAGGLIHSLKEYQDLRKIGSCSEITPVSLRVFSLASIRLCGLPFLAGFFSKDLILEAIIMRRIGFVTGLLNLLATGLTVMYSARAIKLVFFRRSLREPCHVMGEPSTIMIYRILGLVGPSIFGGAFISWLTISRRFTVYLPTWIKCRILSLVCVSAFFGVWIRIPSSPRKGLAFLQLMWFLPFVFRPSVTGTALSARKTVS